MQDTQTPTEFLFEELRSQAHLSNRDAALILLSDRPIYSGRSPRDRIGERTFLSREVVHAQPSRINPAIYADFMQSSQTITSRVASNYGWGDAAYRQIVERYAGSAGTRMVMLLNAYGLEGRIYANATMRIRSMQLANEGDRAVMVMLAFVAAGCLADPRAASDLVERFAREKLAREIGTVVSDVRPRAQQTLFENAPDQLGLVRVVNGAIRPPIYLLSQGPQGTVVGSLPTERSCITDVEVDVSRQHLIVWHQYHKWWCQGMGSTNGTFIVRGGTEEIVVVEHPRSALARPSNPKPIELMAGDTLCLGRRTRFRVVQMSG